jgi:hypothetical protein
MGMVTRGFSEGRDSSQQLPPGQYRTDDFPFSLGRADASNSPGDLAVHRNHRARSDASVELGGADGLQAESITTDIHCVTRWSKLDTAWRGVSLDTLLADVETEADWLTATAVTAPTCRWRICSTAKPGSPLSTTENSLSPSTVDPHDCWSHTCISGNRPSRCAASS